MQELINKIQGDKSIWATVAVLALFSFLPMYSASTNLVYVVGTGTTTMGYFIKHLVLLVFGFAIIYGVHKIPYRYFKGLSVMILPVALALLVYTLMQGTTIGGANASRWIRVPFIGLSFQSSNLGAVVILVYVAHHLSKLNKHSSEQFNFNRSLLYLWLPSLSVVGLIFPANLSSALIILTIIFTLCFIAGYPKKHLFQIFGAGIVFIVLFVLFAKAFPDSMPNRVDTWMNRLDHFFDNESSNTYYQVEKAKIAIANGGITGVGAGKSVMKNFLPQSSSDFIYAIIIEEYGLIGGLFLVLVYMFLFFRLIVLVNKTQEIYGKLLVISLSFYIFSQAFINMAVAVELIPVTGQNLPFISSGGTSIWTTCLSLGVILSVSRSNLESDINDNQDFSVSENINPLEVLSGQL